MTIRIFAGVLLLLWLGLLAVAWQFSAPFTYDPVGPRAYPLLILCLLCLCSLWVVIKPETVKSDWSHLWSVAACIIALVVYTYIFQLLGFLLSTFSLMLFMSYLFKSAWWHSFIFSALASIALYILFDRFLDVSLPLGLLEPLFN
ncbi:tripartite tricarboxylate transporter TctB family protein [Pseudomonas sp. F1_0610]|uniref:tripartite tricarboxylate transporter TctB family protein n=1 Tax=Pseudomonas sp. F1_0610 TaxID=3114284 RepID=UPI0039C395D5